MKQILNLLGNTPCIRLDLAKAYKANLLIKLEGYNPTGSVKDRACFHIINSMLSEGKLRPGMTLLDASSGNYASSLAFWGKLLGFSVEVVVSSKLTKEKKLFIEYLGAKITQFGDFTIDGNIYCRDLITSEDSNNFCFTDQLHNWNNPQAYYENLGPEIVKDVPDVNAIVGSLGSGGTMLGVGRYLKEKKPDVKIVVVEAKSGASIPGIGSFDGGDFVTPFIRYGRENQIFDHVVKIDYQSAFHGIQNLSREGFFCGVQTGGVVWGALQLIESGILEGNVVVISGDSGWKNLDRLINSF